MKLFTRNNQSINQSISRNPGNKNDKTAENTIWRCLCRFRWSESISMQNPDNPTQRRWRWWRERTMLSISVAVCRGQLRGPLVLRRTRRTEMRWFLCDFRRWAHSGIDFTHLTDTWWRFWWPDHLGLIRRWSRFFYQQLNVFRFIQVGFLAFQNIPTGRFRTRLSSGRRHGGGFRDGGMTWEGWHAFAVRKTRLIK